MSLVPFTFKNVELQVVTINGKPWTRAKEVCEALGYKKGRARDALKKHISIKNRQHRNVLQSRAMAARSVSCPKDSQKYDLYINEERMYEVLFGSQQALAKKLRKHCCNVMFPHTRQQLTDKIVEEHHRDVTDRRRRYSA